MIRMVAQVALAITLFVSLQISFLSHARAYNYDEGVYLQTLRSVHAGHPLYRDTFCSQPPAFIGLLSLFSPATDELPVARWVVVLSSSLLIVGVYLLAVGMGFGAWAWPTAALAAVNPGFFYLSHQLKGDAPAVAFATLALGFATFAKKESRASPYFAILAGALSALALLTKLSVIGLVALLPLVLLRNRKAFLLASVSFAAAFAALVLPTDWISHGLNQLQGGSLAGHALGRGHSMTDLRGWDRVRAFFENTDEQEVAGPLLPSLLLVSLIYFWMNRRRDYAVPVTLSFLILALPLALHKTIFQQHFSVLVPLLVLAPVALARELNFRFSRVVPLGLAAVFATNLASIGVAYRDLPRISKRAAIENRVIEELKKNVHPPGTVISDSPFLPAAAGLLSPPSWVDLSPVRIQYQSINCDNLVAASAQPDLKAIVVGKRLRDIDCGETELLKRIHATVPGYREVAIGDFLVLLK